MNWTGRWPLADYQKNPNLKFGIVGLPQKKSRSNAICWAGFTMYPKTKTPDASWLFLRTIGGPEGSKVFGGNALPSIKSVAQDLGLSNDQYNSVVLKELDYLHPLPDLRSRFFNDSVAKELTPALEQLLGSGGDAKAVLDQAASKAQADLDKLIAQNK